MMSPPVSFGPTKRLLRELRHSTSGVAMTEFALSLPVLITLLLGGLELSNLALAHMRVNQIAIHVADNASRVRTTMDESDIYEVFAGAELDGQSIGFAANGRVILSSLKGNEQTAAANKGQTINWQRCYGSLAGVYSRYGDQGKGNADSSLAAGMGPTGNKIVAEAGTAVMFVEVTYKYQPLIATTFMGTPTLRYESAFNVRERTNQSITNTQSLTQRTCPATPAP